MFGKQKEQETKKASICWFSLQMPKIIGMEAGPESGSRNIIQVSQMGGQNPVNN